MTSYESRWLRPHRLSFLITFCVLVVGCGGEPTPEVMAGVDGCASCGMVIDRVNEAAGWVAQGEFVPFCSPGCLLAEHDILRRSGQRLPQDFFFADYHDGVFSPAVETAFLLTEHLPTVMNARVICFNSVVAAEEMRQHDDEIVTDWTGYRVLRGEPDTVIETVFGPAGMDPEVVRANKGDIVLWRVSGDGLEDDLGWLIKGYPEVEPPLVAAAGDPTELRFMATRPGAGFPIERKVDGVSLGMLKVSGAHTADEAAQ
jgi:hypothetical protein